MFSDSDLPGGTSSRSPRTGRDKILDCALRLFAEYGPDATTVRDIAECAQVSPALILHHFGSKQGLREAADALVGSVFDALENAPAPSAEALIQDPPAAAATFAEMLLAGLPPHSPIPAYLRRLLLSGDPVGHQLFARWYRMSHRMLTEPTAMGIVPGDDPEVRAMFLMVNDLAMILLRDHIAEAIGVDPLTPEGATRWAVNAVDAYTEGVFRRDNP